MRSAVALLNKLFTRTEIIAVLQAKNNEAYQDELISAVLAKLG
jgi:hypothetical protein